MIPFNPEKHCLGKLCKHGHDYQGTGQSLRYTNNNECVECVQKRNSLDKNKQRQKKYAANDKGKAAYRRYATSPKGKASLIKKENHRRQSGRAKESRCIYNASLKGKESNRIASSRRRARKRGNLIVRYTREQVEQRKAEFGYSCCYCGKLLEKGCQMDHIISISQGGADAIFNLVPSCTHCNEAKWKHELEKWFRHQEFFCEERLQKVLDVMKQ